MLLRQIKRGWIENILKRVVYVFQHLSFCKDNSKGIRFMLILVGISWFGHSQLAWTHTDTVTYEAATFSKFLFSCCYLQNTHWLYNSAGHLSILSVVLRSCKFTDLLAYIVEYILHIMTGIHCDTILFLTRLLQRLKLGM